MNDAHGNGYGLEAIIKLIKWVKENISINDSSFASMNLLEKIIEL